MSEQESIYSRIADLSLAIEAEMRRLDFWSAQRPSDQALASTQPFCIDTLTFPEWLQFVFLERIQVIIEFEGTLPASSSIAPMAEEHFSETGESAGDIVELLTHFDRLLNQL